MNLIPNGKPNPHKQIQPGPYEEKRSKKGKGKVSSASQSNSDRSHKTDRLTELGSEQRKEKNKEYCCKTGGDANHEPYKTP